MLTLPELREAVGITDRNSDAALIRLGARVAASLARACKIEASGATPATFRQETITVTYRRQRRHFELNHPEELILPRRPVVSIASVTEDGVTLDATDYEADTSAGLLYRLCDSYRTYWWALTTVVVFDAGWDTVPDELKLAAAKTANLIWASNGPAPRDPNLKRERVEGVSEFEYWVPPKDDPLLPQDVLDLLAPYMNVVV